MDRILLANWIMCPDGTMMPSFHRYDFRTRKDEDDKISTVDGGREYLRRGGEYTEMSVYSDDPYEVIRRFVCRGSRGVNGDEELKYIPLCAMDDDYLKAVIQFNIDNEMENSIFQEYYIKEQQYRHDKNKKEK